MPVLLLDFLLDFEQKAPRGMKSSTTNYTNNTNGEMAGAVKGQAYYSCQYDTKSLLFCRNAVDDVESSISFICLSFYFLIRDIRVIRGQNSSFLRGFRFKIRS